jgi:anti-anti-sigma factor
MAFEANLEMVNDVAKITLIGELDASVANEFKLKIEEAAAQNAKKLALIVTDLAYMSSAGLRVLVFAKQKMGSQVVIYVIGAQPQIVEPIKQTGFHYSVTMLDSYDPAIVEVQ